MTDPVDLGVGDPMVMTQSIGVVIPTFERNDLTVRAVNSALAQRDVTVEVVVVDDGSSRESRAQLRASLRELPVHFLEIPRTAHPGRVRNVGIQVLDSDWVALLDSDDVWYPDKSIRQLRAAAEMQSSAVCSNAHRIVRGEQRGLLLPGASPTISFRDLVRSNQIINSSVLVRADVLREVGGVADAYLVRGAEDYATWLRISSLTRWAYVNEPLMAYTDDPEASVRGTESNPYNPVMQAAWLDYIAWRRQSGRPLRTAERLLNDVLARVLR